MLAMVASGCVAVGLAIAADPIGSVGGWLSSPTRPGAPDPSKIEGVGRRWRLRHGDDIPADAAPIDGDLDPSAYLGSIPPERAEDLADFVGPRRADLVGAPAIGR